MIERYIELEGPDKGKVKDVGIAMDLAYIVDSWLEEGDGKPMLTPPERPGKPEVHFRHIVNDALKRLILEEVSLEFDATFNTPEAQANDPENSDPQWIAFRNSSSIAAGEQ